MFYNKEKIDKPISQTKTGPQETFELNSAKSMNSFPVNTPLN